MQCTFHTKKKSTRLLTKISPFVVDQVVLEMCPLLTASLDPIPTAADLRFQHMAACVLIDGTGRKQLLLFISSQWS